MFYRSTALSARPPALGPRRAQRAGPVSDASTCSRIWTRAATPMHNAQTGTNAAALSPTILPHLLHRSDGCPSTRSCQTSRPRPRWRASPSGTRTRRRCTTRRAGEMRQHSHLPSPHTCCTVQMAARARGRATSADPVPITREHATMLSSRANNSLLRSKIGLGRCAVSGISFPGSLPQRYAPCGSLQLLERSSRRNST